MSLQATYAELQHAVRDKFPDAGPLILKYLDREGDLVTITDRNDLQMALKEVIDHADRLQAQHGGPRLPNMIPPLRLHAVKASKEVQDPALYPQATATEDCSVRNEESFLICSIDCLYIIGLVCMVEHSLVMKPQQKPACKFCISGAAATVYSTCPARCQAPWWHMSLHV